MHILLMAPQPFFQPRGTPIAVDLLVKTLSSLGHTVDLLVFHEGEDRSYPGVALHRIKPPAWVRGIRPGLSLKKLVCDAYLLSAAERIISAHRPDSIHAVEESVFVARILHGRHGIPYVYDMDSSMPDQIVEKRPELCFLLSLFHALMRWAVGRAEQVAPVCDALAETAKTRYRAQRITLLRDVSMSTGAGATPIGLRQLLGLQGCVFMYIGNLEDYQGIDLLLEAFAVAREPSSLVVVGGATGDIQRYRDMADGLGLRDRVHFLGPRPLEQIGAHMAEADVLVSPRIKGTNTPMKLYSYLDSGRAVLATRLLTHTQVLDEAVAALAEPDPRDFAAAMDRLARDPVLREQLGQRGRAIIQERYTPAVFAASVAALYGSAASTPGCP